MSRVRSRDTAPERAARRLLTDMGYRYRLHYGRVPGRPDIAFPGRRKAIWVHGCFWHQHPGCSKAALPKSRRDFWIPKLNSNRNRDLAVEAEARSRGWDTLVLWECELKAPREVADRLKRFLDESH
ncbi:MAG: DNA mismatch endonuclease Vsr [Dehalococcoidia bacterium]|nr:DNA mismatch endonuclease Vsr [Acidobacteriota bacterium]MYH68544.1 DNA mismatch endonuclease Vsr [Dehalococcoidia bacterium]